MAKRFFDRQLHKKPWFRELRIHVQAAVRILFAECDEIGIWEIDLRGLNFHLNLEPGDPAWVSLEDLLAIKNLKLRVVEGDKLFIPDFVPFQYGNDEGVIKAGNKMLRKILTKLRKRSLPFPKIAPQEGKETPAWLLTDFKINLSPIDPPCMGDSSPIDGVKEEYKEEEKEGKGGAGEKESADPPVTAADRERLFQAYPCKKGKAKGLKIAEVEIRTRKDLDQAFIAVSNFNANLIRERRTNKHFDPSFVIGFGTFMGEWRDWLDPNHGRLVIDESPSPPVEIKREEEAEPPIPMGDVAAKFVFLASQFGPRTESEVSNAIMDSFGEEALEWWNAIGRQRIAEWPKNDLRGLARFIESTAARGSPAREATA